ncbi:putative Spindle assembly checkpoint kinase [Blattamonas nauphoetae]|uniref:Spindle assembly checkpoint kinase n=1 Tax=Blattamonas nauphoetae TaxID=2049346 RepID=A0ABQ9XVV7_9EUKA|nr:putative Spindle assembly checkpoint kinase [Blattamonas nauphoetae]
MSQPRSIQAIRREEDVLEEKGYKIVKEIGKGSYGRVYLLQKYGTNQLYAGKQTGFSVERSEFVLSLLCEWSVQCFQEKHKNYITQLIEIFRDHHRIFFIQEFANLGDLEKFLAGNSATDESLIKLIIYQLLIPLRTLHHSNIIHRDIKPDNIVLHYDDEKKKVFMKLGDFGELRQQDSEQQVYPHMAGTAVYLAPEAAKNNPTFSGKSDIWAVGVIMYRLLFRKHPYFRATEQQDRLENVHRAIDYSRAPPLTAECADLLQRMLEKDMNKRLSAEQALNHPFFQSLWNEEDVGMDWASYLAFSKRPTATPPVRPEPIYLQNQNRQEPQTQEITEADIHNIIKEHFLYLKRQSGEIEDTEIETRFNPTADFSTSQQIEELRKMQPSSGSFSSQGSETRKLFEKETAEFSNLKAFE